MLAIECPVCHAPFKETVKCGVLIDVCTRCGGVWLDRGELEKLGLDTAVKPTSNTTEQYKDLR